jgi:glycosyltransferase involved in cell wall biosynthesis
MQVRAAGRSCNQPLLSLVFPTYNASRLLPRAWTEIQRFLAQQNESWEVLFVCDGCTDGTSQRLQELLRQSSGQVRVLSYTPNRGKGYAVRHGLAAARGRWRIFTDVDLAYGFDDVLRVAQSLRDGADIAIASRTHAESRLVMPTALQAYAYRRHLQSILFSLLVRRLLPIQHRDTQAGLKGINAATTEKLLPSLRSNGFELDCELLVAATRLGLRVSEVPVCVRYEDRASTTNLQSMTHMLRQLLRIRKEWTQERLPLAVQAHDATTLHEWERHAA